MDDAQLRELDEATLVQRARQGWRPALAEIYRRHADWALALAWRLVGNRDDAQDATQSAFEVFFKKLPDFELRSSLRAYLFVVIKNQCMSLHRRRSKVVALDSLRRPDSEPAQLIQWFAETDSDFERLLAPLSAAQADVLRLRFALGLKLDEIAEALGIATGTVKSRLHSALRALAERHEI